MDRHRRNASCRCLQKLRLKDSFGLLPIGVKRSASQKSLRGTKIIAQGKDAVRNPGNESQTDADPEGVEQSASGDVAPLQGADVAMNTDPGFHPGLLSSSPFGDARVLPRHRTARNP